MSYNPPCSAPVAPKPEGIVTPRTFGALRFFDSSPSNAIYAYGVIEDDAGGAHMFSRAHLHSKVFASTLKPAERFSFFTFIDGEPPLSWAFDIRREATQREGKASESTSVLWSGTSDHSTKHARRSVFPAASLQVDKKLAGSMQALASSSASGPAGRKRWRKGVLTARPEDKPFTGTCQSVLADANRARAQPSNGQESHRSVTACAPIDDSETLMAFVTRTSREEKSKRARSSGGDAKPGDEHAVIDKSFVDIAEKCNDLSALVEMLLRQPTCDARTWNKCLQIFLDSPLEVLLDDEIARVNSCISVAARRLGLTSGLPSLCWSGVVYKH